MTVKIKQVLMQDMPHLQSLTGRSEKQIKNDISFLLKFEGVKLNAIADMYRKQLYTVVKNKYIRFHTDKYIKYRPRTVKEIEALG